MPAPSVLSELAVFTCAPVPMARHGRGSCGDPTSKSSQVALAIGFAQSRHQRQRMGLAATAVNTFAASPPSHVDQDWRVSAFFQRQHHNLFGSAAGGNPGNAEVVGSDSEN
ncbi:hypothetical protein HK100_012351 [Physocladia obscura]|uniref:Uncharacterized protein n=1 Tax=Physocladia obscura TaxID=109957 RepID=A0AAD5T5W1_9FUNG|nr:hypothetical protein HK100_012351 [Physocladia obscura]